MRIIPDLSSNYFVLFQFADPSDGDRARPPGEELDLHEKRQERLKREQLAVICGAVSIRDDLLVHLES